MERLSVVVAKTFGYFLQEHGDKSTEKDDEMEVDIAEPVTAKDGDAGADKPSRPKGGDQQLQPSAPAGGIEHFNIKLFGREISAQARTVGCFLIWHLLLHLMLLAV